MVKIGNLKLQNMAKSVQMYNFNIPEKFNKGFQWELFNFFIKL